VGTSFGKMKRLGNPLEEETFQKYGLFIQKTRKEKKGKTKGQARRGPRSLSCKEKEKRDFQ
jgi:ureidoglycolate hydrolase